MTQVATPGSVSVSFAGSVRDIHGRPMDLSQRGDELWATFDDPDTREHARIARQVVLTTGSHQQQQFWYATGRNRLLGKLPGVFLMDSRTWVPRQAVFLRPPDLSDGSDSGAWNAICISCHTTSGRPQLDVPFGARPALSLNADSQVAEFGIACEACHGPGAAHVAANHNPVRRYAWRFFERPDATIVNPSRVPTARRSQICGQCHSIWEFYGVDGERRANVRSSWYRPGGELGQSVYIARPSADPNSPILKEILADDPRFVEDSFWSDGMVRVSGREYSSMIESPCFRRASDETRRLDCTSCHSMHADGESDQLARWADSHQLAPERDTNEACLQCHGGFRKDLESHTKHRGAAGNSCYNCHMPYTTYGLLRALRSHQVSSPSVATTLKTGRPNACNLCHLDKSLRWTADQLHSVFGMSETETTQLDGNVSAAVSWLLRGDAGQRALLAWALGWPPARVASRGDQWIAPLLASTLDDPYDAVRQIAARSLQHQPGFEDSRYDVAMNRTLGREAMADALARWGSSTHAPLDSALANSVFVDKRGQPRSDDIERLKQLRDTRPLALRE